MIQAFNSILIMLALTPVIIVDFNNTTNPKSWRVIDDVVMGGRSNGSFEINEDGHGVFSGEVSLENNGGFSSVRSITDIGDVSSTDKIKIRLKGDGKSYQFRVKQNLRAYYSYVYTFQTSGEWEEITIPLNNMYPSFRGRKLDTPSYPHTTIREVAFLIGNKKAEEFKLIVDKIELVK